MEPHIDPFCEDSSLRSLHPKPCDVACLFGGRVSLARHISTTLQDLKTCPKGRLGIRHTWTVQVLHIHTSLKTINTGAIIPQLPCTSYTWTHMEAKFVHRPCFCTSYKTSQPSTAPKSTSIADETRRNFATEFADSKGCAGRRCYIPCLCRHYVFFCLGGIALAFLVR